MAYSPDAVRAKLSSLNETQDSIVANAQWIMFHRRHAPSTANLWLERLQASPPNKRLVLIYLANEVVQQSRARGKQDFLLAFEPLMGEATGIAYKGQSSDVQGKIRRVVEVWRQRNVFDGRILEGVEKTLGEIDKSKSSKTGGKLGGSLFGASSNGAGSGGSGAPVPAELQDVAKKQAEANKAESAKGSALETAEKEYAKLTDPNAVLPTPPVHAARLSALVRNLASAQGAVEASINARRELLEGLEKLVATNRAKLSEEEKAAQETQSRREGVEAKKSEVEDGIMRGLSAPTSPTVGTPTSTGTADQNGTMVKDFAAAPEPAAPEAEGFTPPPEGHEPESFTPPPANGEYQGTDTGIDAALYRAETSIGPDMANPTGAENLHEQPPNLEEPPPSFEPPPALSTGPPLPTSAEHAANDFLNNLGASIPLQPQHSGNIRHASGEIPAGSGEDNSADPRLKRRKMSHKASNEALDRDMFGEGAGGAGVDEDGVSALLSQ
ncbi:DUF618-domain-containing protein [Hortaea werneckii]|uniref:CID domain-containing protein n=1 Tax=Hortaea werneckii TaxID=91943 RepID=A0A3M7BT32_HORWE|nr:DUF618-domain-containing protein [Hortaea werneckii]KAI7717347.1 DUF618-domain-containing protein [Hortaea werneckii]RMY42978.1 hypothetical protein D0865_11583 [Hortaea werneckii]